MKTFFPVILAVLDWGGCHSSPSRSASIAIVTPTGRKAVAERRYTRLARGLQPSPEHSICIETARIAFRIALKCVAVGGLWLGAVSSAAVLHEEKDGLFRFEAEDYSAIDGLSDWEKRAVEGTVAMKVLDTGRWARSLRYDLRFVQAGTYHLWLRARKNPTASQYQGNDLKIFFYAAGEQQIIAPGRYAFEIGLREQKEFRWVDWVKGDLARSADLVIPTPGNYALYIVGGAGEEWGTEVDAICLSLDGKMSENQLAKLTSDQKAASNAAGNRVPVTPK